MKSVARAAMAEEGLLGGPGDSDCESEGNCGGGGGPPTLPNIPQYAVSKSAIFFAYPSDGWTSNLVKGTSYYNTNAHDFYLAQFGGGVGSPFTDDVHQYGSGNSYSTSQTLRTRSHGRGDHPSG